MNDVLSLILPSGAGLLLGAFFFGGLWWTIRKGLSSNRPALWFSASMVLRTSITLAGFYAVARSQWVGLLPCLLGFLAARMVVTWLTRPALENPAPLVSEPTHASQC
jgi:F1F0 ATPase subunit 2